MPDILDPYSISDLPQTSNRLSSRLAVSFGEASSKVYFGVSHSALTSYSLQTTARQLWTHPVSPVTQISALHASKRDGRLFFGAVDTKGRASLRQVVARTDARGESEETALLPRCDYVSGIYRSKQKEDVLYVAFRSGEIAAYKIEKTKDQQSGEDKEEGAAKSGTTASGGYTCTKIWDIPAIEKTQQALLAKFLTSAGKDLPEDGLVVTVTAAASDAKSFDVRVVSLDTTEGRVLSSKTVRIDAEEVGVFDLSDNDLYRYVASKPTLYKYSILDPANTTSMKIPSRKEKLATNHASIISLGNDQILISQGSSLKLVDLQYRVLLSERSLERPAALVSYSKKLSVVVGYTFPAEGAPATSNPEKIINVPLDIGKGSLFESIGKGITRGDSTWHNTFSQIPMTFGESSSAQVIKEETALLNNTKNSSTHVLKILQHFKDKGDVTAFEKWALAYLKFSNKWIKTSKTLSVEDTIKATTVPEAETKRPHYKSRDRQVDFTFIYDLCTVLFHHVGRAGTTPLSSLHYGPKQAKLVKLYKGFAPERLLSYLLTHPLLPSQQLPGLLLTLNRFPDIVRAAIRRAPTLRCDTVVSALRAKDKDTFVSAVIRLEHRFDARQITKSVKRVYLSKPSVGAEETRSSKKSQEGSSGVTVDLAFSDNGTTIESIIRRMVELDVGWELMPYFIDAGGLFGWEEAFLSELDTAITERVDDYKSGYEVLAMLEESVREASLTKRSKDAAEEADGSSTPVLLSAKEQSQQRMKSVLHIGFADKYVYDKKKENNSAVAPYTVERLLL